MIYRAPRDDEQALYERLADHPLQAWAWGEFRNQTSVTAKRLIGFDGNEAVSQIQATFHKIPNLPYTVGYYPKGVWPDDLHLAALRDLGEREKAIFIKLEPDVSSPPKNQADLAGIRQGLIEAGCVEGRPLFTKYSFIIDLTLGETELMARMKPKTRYNLKVAEKHGVEVSEDNSDQAFKQYLELLEQTTSRQKFYAHTRNYHTKMWQNMRKAGIARLIKATYQGKTLVTWILFHYKNRLFYPYGASSREHREVMASNLVMWRAIQLGKAWGATSFDLWGALGPEPDSKDPWYGFHNFKLGYGGSLAEFAGSYDLVIQPKLYRLYQTADIWRWRWLKFRAKLGV